MLGVRQWRKPTDVSVLLWRGGGHWGIIACQGLWPPMMPWQTGRYLMPVWRKVCLTFWNQYTEDVSLVKEEDACVCMLSHVQLFVTPWTIACQAPLPMEFSRQEHWSELPFPPPGEMPTYAESSKKQESSRKTSISALLTMPKPLTMCITINCGKFWKRWGIRPPDLPLEKPVCRSGSNS